MNRDAFRSNGVEAVIKKAGSHSFSITYSHRIDLAEERNTDMNDS